MSKPIAFCLLAAGLGKRMNTPHLPKVMSLMSGKPLVGHVIDSFQKLNPNKIILIVGHHKEKVMEYIAQRGDNSNISFAVQAQQLGTGHAVLMAKDDLADFAGDVIIAAGDSPLIQPETIAKLIEAHNASGSVCSVLTAETPEPFGYGRIVRDETGKFKRIVEEKDASEDEKKIREINGGTYMVDCEALFDALSKVKNENAQGEYYLTDIIEILKNEGKTVKAFNFASFDELQGVNSPEQLAQVEEVYNKMKKNG